MSILASDAQFDLDEDYPEEPSPKKRGRPRRRGADGTPLRRLVFMCSESELHDILTAVMTRSNPLFTKLYHAEECPKRSQADEQRGAALALICKSWIRFCYDAGKNLNDGGSEVTED